MTCHLIDDQILHEYVEGFLSEEETFRIERHLLECSICRKAEQELRDLFTDMAALPTGEEPRRDLWPAIAARIAEPDPFLTSLAESIALRQVGIATNMVMRHFDVIVNLDPQQRDAAPTLGYFTQWMEMSGFAHSAFMPYPTCLALAREVFARFPRPPRPFLPIVDCAHLHMVEGFFWLHEEEYDQAIRNFLWILSPDVQHEIGDPDLAAVAGGSLARAYSKKGAYNSALTYADQAIATALGCNRTQLAAAIGVVKGWITFQLNQSKEAMKILEQAESVLRETDDHLALGNIKAAFGRILKRHGRYNDALHSYTPAIMEYELCGSGAQHPNLARSLINKALLKLLLARRAEKRGRVASQGNEQLKMRTVERRNTGGQSAQELRLTASREDLVQANSIYERQRDHRGLGSVLLVSALLRFDDGDLADAALDLQKAYILGKEKSDFILMARARIQQSMLENARFEAHHADEKLPGSHAESARSFAEDAVTLAEQTQNTRLIAHSYIWNGIALLDPYVFDSERAWHCYRKAALLLAPEQGRDLVWDDLQALEKKLATNAPCHSATAT